MPEHLCIHGHFYQPPRFDPWLEEVLPEASAAPFSDWNQRINRESYDPLGNARILSSSGRIEQIINCYEYINFNFGPTILRWMARYSPDTYERILEGDRKSIKLFGRGNAMAQIYHHIIMPLSTDEDRDVEIAWSIQDFESRFKRRPDGFWLSETAVSTPDLEALARAGIKFTVLAPGQAREVSDPEGKNWTRVTEQTLIKDRPYLVRLPSGLQIAVFFYDGPLSQAVAFERLLADGEDFWQRITSRQEEKLLSLATDGESYGHHFKFGEMALAYVLKRATAPDSPLSLTNFASYLEACPPVHEVRIHENSSWSCFHGIARWQDSCGCTAGGHPGWNQAWRKPLRRALNVIRYYVDEHFRHKAGELLKDSRRALLEYGKCLCGAMSREEFLIQHQIRKLNREDQGRALKFLEMQRMSLASFASCAWFFDDLARIEPLNALSCGLRALDLLKDLQGPDVEHLVLEVLEEAQSNDPEMGDGVMIWREQVLSRRMGPARMAAMGACAGNDRQSFSFPGLEFEVVMDTEKVEVNYCWTGFLERGKAGFRLIREQNGAVCGIEASPGQILTLRDLGRQLRSYVLISLDQRQEDRIFNRLTGTGKILAQYSENLFENAQNLPVSGRGMLAPIVLFFYLCSEEDKRDWAKYWQEVLRDNPFLAEIVRSKMEAELNRLTSPETKEWAEAGRIIQRCRAMGIYPDIYPLQNRIWRDGLSSLPGSILEQFDF